MLSGLNLNNFCLHGHLSRQKTQVTESQSHAHKEVTSRQDFFQEIRPLSFPVKSSQRNTILWNISYSFLWTKVVCRKNSLGMWILQKSFANPLFQRGPKHIVGITTQGHLLVIAEAFNFSTIWAYLVGASHAKPSTNCVCHKKFGKQNWNHTCDKVCQ
jgi:hypothetical protein